MSPIFHPEVSIFMRFGDFLFGYLFRKNNTKKRDNSDEIKNKDVVSILSKKAAFAAFYLRLV